MRLELTYLFFLEMNFDIVLTTIKMIFLNLYFYIYDKTIYTIDSLKSLF